MFIPRMSPYGVASDPQHIKRQPTNSWRPLTAIGASRKAFATSAAVDMQKMGMLKAAQDYLKKFAKDMPHFEDQDRDPKAKEVYHALKRDHPEYSAGKKARIAESVANKTAEFIMEKIGRRTTFEILKEHKVPLTPEEREKVMKSGAVWHYSHSPGGKPVPAVWKSIRGSKTTYVTHTHRAYNQAPTLEGAINRFHKFIKSTA